ncbi:MAG: hypothetical protein GYA02_10720 [Clostridiaceae bacterium]|jgi:hypothetical protein|nr:hypothetical protein [Clostridiaceae bacterium]
MDEIKRIWLHNPKMDLKDYKLFGGKHIEAVIAGNDVNKIRNALDQKLTIFVSLHAFSAKAPFDREEYLCRDVDGKPHIWFGSPCPNKLPVMERFIENIEKVACIDGVEGVFLDGCRFASPCSSNNIEAFLTCFCPDCCRKCEDLGYDMDIIKRDVKTLHCLFSGFDSNIATEIRCVRSKDDLFRILPGLREWIEFRIACVNGFLELAREAVKKHSKDKKLCMYSFFPAISLVVGQRYKDMREYVDLFSPMLYRRYNSPVGPACMDHEISRLVGLLSENPQISSKEAIQIVQSVTGFSLEGFNDAEDIMHGLQPFHVYEEAKRVIDEVASRRVVPIIMMEDSDIPGHFYQLSKLGLDTVSFY